MVSNQDKNIRNKIKNISIIYIALIAVFTISMVLSYAIPNKRIVNHVKESIPQLQTEGLYPRLYFGTPACQLDNFTDSWMLTMAISADNKNPIKSSMKVPYKATKNKGQSKIDILENTIDDDNALIGSYNRYWHGYQVILRPLLFMFNLMEIRYINMFLLFGLFMVVNYLMKKKLGTKYMLSFFISMMMVMFIIVPMSLQFSSIFYIAFISMIIILSKYKKIIKNKWEIYIFFIIGCITSFMDLLTVPLLTLGIPLITYILLENKENKNNSNPIKVGLDAIKISVIWSIGYAITWVSKWIIASIVLKENMISKALSQAATRSSNTVGGVSISKIDAIKTNIDMVLNSFTFKLFIVFFIVWTVIYIYNKNKSNNIISKLPVLMVGVYPIVWYALLTNHSKVHFWFTYRNLAITIFAVLTFMVSLIDENKIKKYIEHKRLKH